MYLLCRQVAVLLLAHASLLLQKFQVGAYELHCLETELEGAVILSELARGLLSGQPLGRARVDHGQDVVFVLGEEPGALAQVLGDRLALEHAQM